jgi:hypothetical protein
MDHILENMNYINADGVDFIPLCDALAKKQCQYYNVIASYTKEQWTSSSNHVYPKTPYVFWKIVNGSKVYIG